MCLILLAYQSHPDYPLIIAANRDEFYQRPTAAAGLWNLNTEQKLLAGRDLQAGGTWLGVNSRGQFAAVTNVRNGLDTQTRPGSRGELVTDCLLSEDAIPTVLEQITHRGDHYNGFNLLAGSPKQLFYCTNRSPDLTSAPQYTVTPLTSGLYGLSNARLDSNWPKVASAKEELKNIVSRDWSQREERQAELLAMLADTHRPPVDQLPETGISLDKEIMLSSRFIASPEYGTRASTVVLFHRSGHIHFSEKTFEPGQAEKTEEFVIKYSSFNSKTT